MIQSRKVSRNGPANQEKVKNGRESEVNKINSTYINNYNHKVHNTWKNDEFCCHSFRNSRLKKRSYLHHLSLPQTIPNYKDMKHVSEWRMIEVTVSEIITGFFTTIRVIVYSY